MTRRKLALIARNSDAGFGAHDAMPLAAILPGLHHPLVALPIERVVELHAGFAVLDAKLYRGSGRVTLERHGGHVHVHGRHIQPGLRLARVQIFDHCLADRVLVLDVFLRTGRQKQRRREQRDSFHFIDYTCLLRFAV